MSNEKTPDDLRAIAARATAALPGPWHVNFNEIRNADGMPIGCAYSNYLITKEEFEANTLFIAHAREDVPALLGALAQMQEAMRWRDAATELPREKELLVIEIITSGKYEGRHVLGTYDKGKWWAEWVLISNRVKQWRYALPEPPTQARASGTGEGEAL